MMNKKRFQMVTTLSIIIMIVAPPALGISVSSRTDSMSSSENYNLDDHTSLQGKTTLGKDALFQTIQLAGSGNNEVAQQVSGDGHISGEVLNVRNSDHFDASISPMASSQGSTISSGLAGSGDIVSHVYGSAGVVSTEQSAAVISGEIATVQNVATYNDFSASAQNTDIKGEAGAIISKSNSLDNNMALAGGFSTTGGDLNAGLVSVAADHAEIHGTASILGEKCIDNDLLKTVSSDNLEMRTEGACADSNKGFGSYGLSVTNIVAPSQYNVPYAAGGWRWVSNPQIHILLSGPTISSSNLVAQEISKAANTWDLNTGQNIFKGSDAVIAPGTSNAVEVTSYVPAFGNNMDGKNIHAWTYSLAKPTIAQTTTWSYTNTFVAGSDGLSYKKTIESDCWYNANYAWRIAGAESPNSNSYYDVRTIATHELGHTLGLMDLYGTLDVNKIMYGYNSGEVKWSLRDGDKSGLWTLYGK